MLCELFKPVSTSQPNDVIAREKLTLINASDRDFDKLNSNQISDDDFHSRCRTVCQYHRLKSLSGIPSPKSNRELAAQYSDFCT